MHVVNTFGYRVLSNEKQRNPEMSKNHLALTHFQLRAPFGCEHAAAIKERFSRGSCVAWQ